MFEKESHYSQHHAGLEHKVFLCADPVMITTVQYQSVTKIYFKPIKKNCLNKGKIVISTLRTLENF